MKIQVKETLDAMLLRADTSLNDRRSSLDYYKQYKFGRQDIVCVQITNGTSFLANLFYGVNGFEQMDIGCRVEVDQEAKDLFRTMADSEWLEVDKDYKETHKAFFAELRKQGIIY